MRGYERALIEHGIGPQLEWRITCDCDGQDGKRDAAACPAWIGWYEESLSFLRKLELPVALCVMSSYAGRGLLTACRELGLDIPRDVSIICFDDAEFIQALVPPITAVRQRASEIASTAVELLERRLSNETIPEPRHILLDMELVERRSVAVVR